MIASMSYHDTDWTNGCTYTYYFPVNACTSSYYYSYSEKDSVATIRKKWWSYLQSVLGSCHFLEIPIRWLIAKPSLVNRIHHERQHRRILKGRNNRNP